MIYVALFLVAANLLMGDVSIIGRRLELSRHPSMVRLRWLGIGMVLALVLSGYDWNQPGWPAWTATAIRAASSARHFALRRSSHKRCDGSGEAPDRAFVH